MLDHWPSWSIMNYDGAQPSLTFINQCESSVWTMTAINHDLPSIPSIVLGWWLSAIIKKEHIIKPLLSAISHYQPSLTITKHEWTTPSLTPLLAIRCFINSCWQSLCLKRPVQKPPVSAAMTWRSCETIRMSCGPSWRWRLSPPAPAWKFHKRIPLKGLVEVKLVS